MSFEGPPPGDAHQHALGAETKALHAISIARVAACWLVLVSSPLEQALNLMPLQRRLAEGAGGSLRLQAKGLVSSSSSRQYRAEMGGHAHVLMHTQHQRLTHKSRRVMLSKPPTSAIISLSLALTASSSSWLTPISFLPLEYQSSSFPAQQQQQHVWAMARRTQLSWLQRVGQFYVNRCTAASTAGSAHAWRARRRTHHHCAAAASAYLSASGPLMP